MKAYCEADSYKTEIEQLQAMLNRWQSDLARCNDPETRKHIMKLITRINDCKNKLTVEYDSIIAELEEIKAENAEVYWMLYWHDVKHLTWLQTFNKVCPDLIYAYPDSYCKKTVHKYLARKFNLPKWR